MLFFRIMSCRTFVYARVRLIGTPRVRCVHREGEQAGAIVSVATSEMRDPIFSARITVIIFAGGRGDLDAGVRDIARLAGTAASIMLPRPVCISEHCGMLL